MKPILVTGNPRSGTTWIGKMLSIPSNIGYIHEAYNILIKNNLPGDQEPFEFAHVTEEEYDQIYEEYDKIFSYNSTFFDFFATKKTFLNFINSIYQHFRFRKLRVQEKRPLIKDAYSLFATEFLVDEFDCKPVILIRHPGPIYESIRRLDWKIDFDRIYELESSERVAEEIDESQVLEEEEVEEILSNTERIGLLWNIIHKKIIQYQEKHEDWYFIRYEDIFTNLEHNFKELYDYCDLDISDSILSKIYHYTAKGHFPSEHTPNEIEMPRHDLLNGWKNRLPEEEKEELRKFTDNEIFSHFYDQSSWEIHGQY